MSIYGTCNNVLTESFVNLHRTHTDLSERLLRTDSFASLDKGPVLIPLRRKGEGMGKSDEHSTSLLAREYAEPTVSALKIDGE